MNNSATKQLALATGQQPVIAANNQDVDMSAIIEEWKLSKTFIELNTRDFKELDNLVDGIGVNKQDDAPFVGDTTMAGLVRQIPRDSLEQIPVFSAIINGTKNSIAALLGTFFLKKFVFNEDTFGKGLLATLQLGAEQALTHGYAPFMCSTGTMYSDFGTTLRLLHFEDAMVEPGIQDGNEMGYSYVVANLTKTRVKKILANAKKNPQSSWNVAALTQLLETEPRSTNYSIYQSDARKNNAAEQAAPTYQFVTRYETGADGIVVTFCPEVAETALRVMDSRSKFGYPRLLLLVIDPAPLTPFGMSRVRLASPNQNLMNIYYGNIASMLLLNSKPPILKRGRFTKPVQLKQGAVWETLDQNAAADLKNMDNGALEHFVAMQQQFATQISTIMGRGPGTAQEASKTAPGVEQQGKIQDASTNQITKILENFLRQYALVALDTVISEQEGEQNVIVDDETKNGINNIAPGTIGDDNKILVNWNDYYASIEDWSVDIEVSVSKDQLAEKKRADTQDMLTVLAQNASDLGPETQQKIQQLTDMLMEDITPDVKPLTIGQQAPPPPPTPQIQPGQVPGGGGMVHESGDLVKLFLGTTDPNLRNHILKMLNLPPVAQAMPAQVVPPPTAPVAPQAPAQ